MYFTVDVAAKWKISRRLRGKKSHRGQVTYMKYIRTIPVLIQRILFTVLAVGLMASFGLAQSDTGKKVEALVMSAIELQRAGDLDGAITKYSEAIKLAPMGLLYSSRGIAYMGKKDKENAFNDLSKGLELGISDKRLELVTRKLRALIYLDRDKNQEAIEDLSLVIAEGSTDSRDYALRGKANFLIEKTPEALADMNKSIELDPKNELALFYRAKIFLSLKRPEKALADINGAISVRPDGTNYYTTRALAYRQLGKNEEADADDKKAAELRARPRQ